MDLPLCLAMPPRWTGPVPTGILPGETGFRLSSQPPYVLSPEAPLSGARLLFLNDAAPVAADAAAFCADAVQETVRQTGVEGVYLDFERTPCPETVPFVQTLDRQLRAADCFLIVPEPWIPATAYALASIPARLTGGTLEQRFQEAVRQYPNGVCVELTAGGVCFSLPWQPGMEQLLTLSQAEQLADAFQSRIHFSEELCCQYFFHIDADIAWVCLLDSPVALSQKYRLARDCGARLCAGMYSELWPWALQQLSTAKKGSLS